jgi:hypothetical protein
VPGKGELVAADTEMAVRADVVTVMVVVPVIEELLVSVAVMVDVPAPAAVASPLLALMVATVVLEDDQVADTLLAVVPSLFTPVAVNCWVVPTTTLGLAGLMLIEVRVGLTKN